MQGATGRSWCDFVIFTFKGVKVIRVNYDSRFWNAAFPKLKFCYYFYMLPLFIPLHESISDNERKWAAIKNVQLLQNGLVDDVSYYKQFSNGRVTIFAHLDCPVKEHLVANGLTVSLCIFDWRCFHIVKKIKFSVPRPLHLYSIVKQKFRVVRCFHADHNKRDVDYAKPESLRLGRSQSTGTCFVALDPLGSCKQNTAIFKPIQRFLVLYNKLVSVVDLDGWNLRSLKHMTQADSYNCSLYIIYFIYKRKEEEKHFTH